MAVLNLDASFEKERINEALKVLTEAIQQISLSDRLFKLAIHGRSMPIETSKGWRSSTFYLGDEFELKGIRRTKRGGIVFTFGGGMKRHIEHTAVELGVDDAEVAFNRGIHKFLAEYFGSPDVKDIIEGYESTGICRSIAGMGADPDVDAAPNSVPQPLKKLTPADLYAEWGTW